MDLRVLLIQNNAIVGNKEATLNNIDTLLTKYAGESFDLIVLPEVFAIGWQCKDFQAQAEQLEKSETIEFLKNIALTFKSIVIGGSIIIKSDNGEYLNTCPVISKEGKLVTTYDKIHLFSHIDAEENKYIKSGNELKILDLGFTKIGLSICYDIRFPEIYRAYSRNGVEIFINVAAWSKTKPEHWDIMHKARAIENQCFMIVANQTGKITNNGHNLGHSMVLDPWGSTIIELKEEESCAKCIINTEQLKELRKTFPLLKDRKDTGNNCFKIKEININD